MRTEKGVEVQVVLQGEVHRQPRQIQQQEQAESAGAPHAYVQL
jgi:hypothetical protein